jgi:rare lipoprotein A
MFLRLILFFVLSILGLKFNFTPIVKTQKKEAFSFLKQEEVKSTKGKTWVGIASFYHNKFHGRKTASGELFDQNKMTCANNFLPLGSQIKVTNLKNGKTVFVKVNDRLAKSNKRLIDLSFSAANKLGFVASGLQKVEIEVVNKIHSNEIEQTIQPVEPIISTEETKSANSENEQTFPKKKIVKVIRVNNSTSDDSLDLSKYNYIKK